MIQLYSGTPGSGKSLHACHLICTYLKCGKRVISTMNCDTDLVFYSSLQKFLFNNFGIKPKKFKKNSLQRNFQFLDNNVISPEFLYEWASRFHTEGKENQTLLIIDECVQLFSPTVIGDRPQLWNRWETFFRVHRHLGFNVVLIPQSARLISRKVLCYCEYDVKHFNRKNQGFFGWFLALLCGSLFYYKSMWRGVKGESMDSGFFFYKPIYGAMYNSYILFGKTVEPYLKSWEKKKILLSKLCYLLNERVNTIG